MSDRYSDLVKSSEPKTEFKDVGDGDRTEMIEAAVRAVIHNISQVNEAHEAASKLEVGQLAILQNALEHYPEPITEDAWESMFKSKVTALLDEASSEGSSRYANAGSRDVMVNLFKVASMGLTLAKQDVEFAPTPATASNLKKYAAVVRPLLQKTVDPVTGKPRLRSIAASARVRPGHRLVDGAMYWLIGCEDREAGIQGPNAVLGADTDLRKLEEIAARLASKYEAFFYCEAKMQDLSVPPPAPVTLMISNSAAMAETIASFRL